MATTRRLSDDDVKTVFDCVHNNKRPPAKLQFQIVLIGSNGLKLSPPPFEYEDGLYVLVKPEKKKEGKGSRRHSKSNQPKVPSNLADFVMTKKCESVCPWSLSGPQFPTPTAIQQRYCYPKGNPIYSGQKGGALWTTYCNDGNEDTEFRLLHVYYSAKRAINKGIRVSSTTGRSSIDEFDVPSPPQKKHKHKKFSSKIQKSPHLSPVLAPAPSSLCSSPLSFEILPPSPNQSEPPKVSIDTSSGVGLPLLQGDESTGIDHFVDQGTVDAAFDFAFYPIEGSLSEEYGMTTATTMPPTTKKTQHIYRPKPRAHRPCKMNRRHQSNHSYSSIDSHCSTESSSLSALGRGVPGQMSRRPPRNDEDDDIFHYLPPEPLLSFDAYSQLQQNSNGLFPTQERKRNCLDYVKSFRADLDTIHESLLEKIFMAKDSNQGCLANMVAAWARRVAQFPLGKNGAKDSSAPQSPPSQTNKETTTKKK